MSKPYKARSLKGAEARVRLLQQQVTRLDRIAHGYWLERHVLAKLAAEGPAFFNPLEAAEAKTLRDSILKELHLNPDGSFMK